MDNILHSNKLIADFMGYEGQHEEWCGNNVLQTCSITGEKQMFPYSPDKSYSDIMPVIERIESLGWYTCIEHYEYGHLVLIKKEAGYGSKWQFAKESSVSKIDAICKGVISFIEWYNNQKEVDNGH